MNNPQPSRALFIRMDRIGDLVLTLPVDQALSETEVRWWIPQGLSFVTQASHPQRNAREMARTIQFIQFLKLCREVRNERFDLAVVFQGPWWVSLLLWLARVPVRIGVRSKLHSFLFFNRGVRQKRSRSEHSELEYNFRLLEEGLKQPIGSLNRAHLHLKPALNTQAIQALLTQHGLQSQNYSVVHPGMGGSALNWPTEHYAELIRELSLKGKVAVTGTAADEPFLKPLRALLTDMKELVWLDKKLKGPELIAILHEAKQIVAPSTGVLHLAASTGRPTLGLFSPVRVQQPRRWGPQGERVATVMPQTECPGELSCLGPQCAKFDCMRTITPQTASESLNKLS